jgi:Ca2+-binding EF-hand superfamily protein
MVISLSERLFKICLAGAVALTLTAADDPIAAERKRSEAAKREADEVAEALRDAWPDHPDWVDMFADILAKHPIEAGDGWFRRDVAHTRFDWSSTRKRFDRDGDGRIKREEVPVADADFARLDRSRDGLLTATDFDFSSNTQAPSPAALLFYRADRDANGKVTREELDAFFRASDSGGQGFLSLSDLREALPQPQPARGPQNTGGVSKAMLVRSLFRQELGSLQPGPKLDESAPDFTLRSVGGREEVTLSKLIGPRPVVLVFGNFTCSPFRGQAGNIEKLYQRHKDRATFVMIYVREAHPTDGWVAESNERVGISLRQPRSYEERTGVAQTCSRALGLGMPMLVDTIDDKVGGPYSGMPSRLYLIDREGKVAYKSGRGPFGFKPAELEHSLILLLQADSTIKTPQARVSPPDQPAHGRDNLGQRNQPHE